MYGQINNKKNKIMKIKKSFLDEKFTPEEKIDYIKDSFDKSKLSENYKITVSIQASFY